MRRFTETHSLPNSADWFQISQLSKSALPGFGTSCALFRQCADSSSDSHLRFVWKAGHSGQDWCGPKCNIGRRSQSAGRGRCSESDDELPRSIGDDLRGRGRERQRLGSSVQSTVRCFGLSCPDLSAAGREDLRIAGAIHFSGGCTGRFLRLDFSGKVSSFTGIGGGSAASRGGDGIPFLRVHDQQSRRVSSFRCFHSFRGSEKVFAIGRVGQSVVFRSCFDPQRDLGAGCRRVLDCAAAPIPASPAPHGRHS